MAYSSFEDLEVWKRACRLTVDVYKNIKSCKDFAFKEQITKSALSVPSNIAEGSERNSIPDFIRFLNIAKASAGELRTQLYIAQEIDILSANITKPLIDESKEISSMIYGLIKSLRNKQNL